jgi:uncharacterized protein (DUF1697 family)
MPSASPLQTFVALLRGINVGKAKRIAMADLRLVVEGLGFSGVQTLLNSGNVVLSGPTAGADTLASRIEEAIAKQLGIASRVTVITSAETMHAVQQNPLAHLAADESKLLIAVPASVALLEKLKPLAKQDWAPEALVVGSRFAWVWSPQGVLESKSLAAVNRILKDSVTVRNLATMRKLEAMCSPGSPG